VINRNCSRRKLCVNREDLLMRRVPLVRNN
jgi:hypothetical protein